MEKITVRTVFYGSRRWWHKKPDNAFWANGGVAGSFYMKCWIFCDGENTNYNTKNSLYIPQEMLQLILVKIGGGADQIQVLNLFFCDHSMFFFFIRGNWKNHYWNSYALESWRKIAVICLTVNWWRRPTHFNFIFYGKSSRKWWGC